MTVATKPKRRVRKKKPSKKSADDQHADFVAAVRKLGLDESGADFDRVFKKIVPTKPGRKRGS